MSINELTRQIIGFAMKIHGAHGPGLFQSVYETCMCHELAKCALAFRRQEPIPIFYDGIPLEESFYADVVVENRVHGIMRRVNRLHDA